jgi:N-methylhydantoinase A
MFLGVDVGGTFTDAVLADLEGGRILTAKSPTTPGDQSQGAIAAVEAVLARAGVGPHGVRRFAHGMTVATNALLEGRWARAALVATEGFTDIVALGRQARPRLYDLCAAPPAPLIAEQLRFPAPERMGPNGPIRPLSEQDARALAHTVAAATPEAVAVVLLHSYRHPAHELALGEALHSALPQASIHLSHQTVGTFREYERAATTELDAALSPLLARYLLALGERCAKLRLPEPTIMQSNGGLIDLRAAAAHAAWTLLSGPAGGAAGAALVARRAGIRDALCFDMGGTSCDVCVVRDGVVQERASGVLGGRPVALPMLAIHTVGAGGGSIAWADAGGALRVGPRSAGADPGPACYGRGGREPTVTDANLLLGYLDFERPLGGAVALDAHAARTAVGALAARLGLGVEQCAEGIRRVAAIEMARALRVVSVQRGIDPRGFALLAFGGAGGLHALQIASELGISRIAVPRAAGVLAALGLVAAGGRREAQQTVMLSEAQLSPGALHDRVAELAHRARAQLRGVSGGDDGGQVRCTYEVRYCGQSFELAVVADADVSPATLRELFEAEHERRYGFRDDGQEIELVTVRVGVLAPAPAIELGGAGASGDWAGHRMGIFNGRPVELAVFRGTPRAGERIVGPAVIELADSTVLVEPGWAGGTDDAGTLVLERVR